MDTSRVLKGSLIKVIAELRTIVPKEQFEATVRKFIPDGLDGIENIQCEPVKRPSIDDSNKKTKKLRVFDITKYRRRHIALRVFYDGSTMGGFAQHDSSQLIEGVLSDNSIETTLFTALKRVNLIDDITKCHYQRCGRTDVGVSAFNQVVSLYLRSNLRTGAEFVDEYDPTVVYNPPDSIPSKPLEEFDYSTVLNKVLPSNIRVTGWCPVSRDFSARFSCCGRVYRYYFLRRGNDIERMRLALKQLEGEHDFRNFCRIDTINVCDFTRTIFKGDVVEIKKGMDSEHDVLAIEIIGRAFLWHQIRCIMSVLFLVGSGKESPDVVSQLLDIQKSPKKPQYIMADPEPLVLYDCIFNPGENAPDSQNKRYFDIIKASPYFDAIEASNEDTKYNSAPCCFSNSLSDYGVQRLMDDMQSHLYTQSITLSRYEQVTEALQAEYAAKLPTLRKKISDFRELNTKKYTPLAKRTTAPSYEDRVRSLGEGSLQKLKNRYQYVDLESNEFIPDVIKEKLNQKCGVCCDY